MGAIARVVSTALVTAGLILLIEVATTLVWQEPMSAIYAASKQGNAEAKLETATRQLAATAPAVEVTAEPAEEETRAERQQRQRRAARQLTRFADESAAMTQVGDAAGHIRIDTIGLDTIFFFGIDDSTLRSGPGLYPQRSFPGQQGTSAIAGHRSTYGAPFRDLDRLVDGDEIVLEMPHGTFTYAVVKAEIVLPRDVRVVDQVDYQRLVLTACHPLYSAAQRYVVTANLVEARTPEGVLAKPFG